MAALSVASSSVSKYIRRLNISLTNLAAMSKRQCLFRNNGRTREQKPFVCTFGSHWVIASEGPQGPPEIGAPCFILRQYLKHPFFASIIGSLFIYSQTFLSLMGKQCRIDFCNVLALCHMSIFISIVFSVNLLNCIFYICNYLTN